MSPEETTAAILTHLQHCPPGCHGDTNDYDAAAETDYLSPAENDWRAGHNHPGRKP